MPKVRTGSDAKWNRRASSATVEYTEGVSNPRTPWAAATLSAAANQAAGIQQAITEKRFEKGVQKAGDSKWQNKATNKGARNYAPGIQDAQNAYATGVAPYLQTIESITLPPRFPKGDPRNIARVTAIATALRNRKIKG